LSLEPVYGPHPSRCLGVSLGVDPVSFSTSCYMACAMCSVLNPVRSLLKYSPGELVKRVERDLEERELKIDTIYVYGSSDPFLYDELTELVKGLREVSEQHGSRLVVRTLGYFQRALEAVVALVDQLHIPFYIADMDWNTLYRPSINVTRSEYLEKLRELFNTTRETAEKLILEVVVARQGAESVFTDYLDDYLILIKRLKARKVLLKTIDRPVRQSNLKPVSRQTLERLKEMLEDEGSWVQTCLKPGAPPRVRARRAFIEVYNHVLRKPLKANEVNEIYGEIGIVAAETLVSRRLVSKQIWENQLFYLPSK